MSTLDYSPGLALEIASQAGRDPGCRAPCPMRSAGGGANPSLDIELRSALGFEEGALQIHQVLAVRPTARGSSGVPLRPEWERTALPAAGHGNTMSLARRQAGRCRCRGPERLNDGPLHASDKPDPVRETLPGRRTPSKGFAHIREVIKQLAHTP